MPDPVDEMSFAELVAEFRELNARREDGDDLWFDWQTGVVGGGPNGDGRYPLMTRAGSEVLVLCPAAMAALLLDTGYRAQIGFDAALTAAERFAKLMMPAAVRFKDDFVDCMGLLLGTAPAATMNIAVRRFAANGTGGAQIGTISVATNRAVTFSTSASGTLDLAAGEVLAFEGPVTPQAATELILLFKGDYL